MPSIDLAPADLSEGEMRQFQVRDRFILVCRVDGALYALNSVCPHRGAFVAQGKLHGTRVTCPWHEWSFDVKTGRGITNPLSCLETWPVREQDGRILLEL